jgi:hypothetical protein
LTNEEAEPLGEGTWLGKAIEVRISDTPDFTDQPWQPWEPLLPWLLADTQPGDYAVYVEYRDGAGRTAVAQDTIRLVAEGEALPTSAVALPVDTPAPTSPAESTEPAPAVVPTSTPGAASASQPTPMADLLTPAPPVSEVYPTWTPLPLEPVAPEAPVQIDWLLLAFIALQGFMVVLGLGAFLRRR